MNTAVQRAFTRWFLDGAPRELTTDQCGCKETRFYADSEHPRVITHAWPVLLCRRHRPPTSDVLLEP